MTAEEILSQIEFHYVDYDDTGVEVGIENKRQIIDLINDALFAASNQGFQIGLERAAEVVANVGPQEYPNKLLTDGFVQAILKAKETTR
jgi:hypothetical protein